MKTLLLATCIAFAANIAHAEEITLDADQAAKILQTCQQAKTCPVDRKILKQVIQDQKDQDQYDQDRYEDYLNSRDE